MHVDAERGFSGGETQAFLLMDGLRAIGQRVVLVAPPRSAALLEAERRGIPCAAVRLRNDMDLRSALALRRVILQLRPDIVHLHTGRATWLGGHAARWARTPAICTRRMDREVKRGMRTRWIYSRLLVRVAAISASVRELLVAGGVEPARIVLIPDGVDPELLRPQRPKGELRCELGATPADFVLLVLATLVRRKGVDVLLVALTQLATRGLRPTLWIAGEGGERAELERITAERGLTGVRFLGRREDVAELLAACDVLIQPSRREGLGVAVLEAMAAGRAVIASAVGGLADVVVQRECGLLVPPEDPVRLAAAIEELHAHPDLRMRLAACGPIRVAQGYLASQMVAAYDELYSDVLAEVARR